MRRIIIVSGKKYVLSLVAWAVTLEAYLTRIGISSCECRQLLQQELGVIYTKLVNEVG